MLGAELQFHGLADFILVISEEQGCAVTAIGRPNQRKHTERRVRSKMPKSPVKFLVFT